MIEHLELLYITHTHTHQLPNVTLASIEFSHARSIKPTFNCLLFNKAPIKHTPLHQ